MKNLSSWRSWLIFGGIAIVIAFGIARRDRIGKIFGITQNAAPNPTQAVSGLSSSKNLPQDFPSNSETPRSESGDVAADSDSRQTHKVLSPDEEVLSWGEPVIEGEVRLEDLRFAHQAVYRTQLKYPLIMVQQIWQMSESDPKRKDYVGERKMVADHLVVRLRDAEDLSSFEQKIAREGMSLRKQMYAGGLYLISFPLENINTYQEMQRRLMALPEVKSVAPDIYGRGF